MLWWDFLRSDLPAVEQLKVLGVSDAVVDLLPGQRPLFQQKRCAIRYSTRTAAKAHHVRTTMSDLPLESVRIYVIDVQIR